MSGWISEEVGSGGSGGSSGGLTNAELRATPIPVAATALPLPAGASTEANQTTTNTSLSSIDAKVTTTNTSLASIDTDIGSTADAAAASDTGSFSIISLIKRGLTNWSTLLGRIPAPIDGQMPVIGNVTSSNITTKFREAFETYTPNAGRWIESKASGDLVFVDGNSSSASYLVISKDPLSAGTETSVEPVIRFAMPIELAFGSHLSQRTLGQEFSTELVSADSLLPDVADLEILSIVQSGTTITITTINNHSLVIGKSVGVRSAIDSRINYPALVIASVPAPNQFTCTAGPGGNIQSISANTATVVAATTAALPTATYANGAAGVGATLTATTNGAFPSQDGISIPLLGRILVKNQALALENGVYVLTTVGTAGTPWVLTRATDFDTTAELTIVAGALFAVSAYVANGTTQAQRTYYLSATVTTVGTTGVTFIDSGRVAPLGYIFFRERFGRAQNGVSQIFESPTVTNASLYIRSESGDAFPSGTIAGNHSTTIASTASTQLLNSPYTYAFAPTTEFRINVQADRTQWYDSPVDSLAQTTSRLLRTQVCPDPTPEYKIRIRTNNSKSLTVPIAQIVSAVKLTAITTPTITTDVPHGLVVGDLVVLYGARDQTVFANAVAVTPVLTVPDATTFTAVWGTAAIATTYGGYVARVHGGNLMSALGAQAVVAQSASLTTLSDGTRQLVLTGNTNWGGGLLIGDLINVMGLRESVAGVTLGCDGPWKVANNSTTTLTLVLPFSNQRILPVDFGATLCGGGVIKRTDIRVSFVRIFDYERERVEMLSRPVNDISAAAPVAIQNVPAVAQSGTWTTGQGAAAAIAGRWYQQLTDGTSAQSVKAASTAAAVTDIGAVFTLSPNSYAPTQIQDVVSAAITTTTTTAAFTPTGGMSYEINIPVTAISGTPTMDVNVEESDDGGTNWFVVYSFPRITAVGMYRSPKLPLTGNRVRYVQTIGGGTPSLTRAINRVQCYDQSILFRQLVDRSIVLTTLNSVTPSLNVQGCRNLQLVINVGAITTTAPALQLQASEDGGVTWFNLGTPLTAVANSTVQATVSNVTTNLLRAIVTTAGVAVTAGYVLIKGF